MTRLKARRRLEQVNDIARADVASRGGNPDEVEVYLAYQDRDWQSASTCPGNRRACFTGQCPASLTQ